MLLRQVFLGLLVLCMSVAARAQEPAGESVGPSPSPAVEAAARDLFDRGTEAWDAGRFDDALSLWEQAHDLAGWPRVLFNIASAHDRLGHGPEAIARYEAFLAAVPDAPNREATERRLEELRAVEREPVPAPWSEVVDPTPPPLSPPARGPDYLLPAVVLAGAGALGLGGIVTGAWALSLRADLDGRCPDHVCDPSALPDLDLMEALSITTDVLFAVALVGGVAGVVTLVIASTEVLAGAARISARVTCGPLGCELTGRF